MRMFSGRHHPADTQPPSTSDCGYYHVIMVNDIIFDFNGTVITGPEHLGDNDGFTGSSTRSGGN